MSWQQDIRSRRVAEPWPQTLLADLHAPLVAAALTLQVGLALLLAARAIAAPNNHTAATTAAAGGLLVWAVVTAMLAALARWLWFTLQPQSHGPLGLAARYLPLVAVSITAASIPVTGAGLSVTAAAWLLLAIEELVIMAALPGGRIADGWLPFRSAWPGDARRGVSARRAVTKTRAEASTAPESATGLSSLSISPAPGTACVQRLNRVQAVDGDDRLEGSLSTRFAAGQTTGLIHVAFCPSFARVPALDYRQQAGPPARIKLGQLLPHGARFEIKLAEPAQSPLHVTLEIIARQTPKNVQTPVPAPGRSAERTTSSQQ